MLTNWYVGVQTFSSSWSKFLLHKPTAELLAHSTALGREKTILGCSDVMVMSMPLIVNRTRCFAAGSVNGALREKTQKGTFCLEKPAAHRMAVTKETEAGMIVILFLMGRCVKLHLHSWQVKILIFWYLPKSPMHTNLSVRNEQFFFCLYMFYEWIYDKWPVKHAKYFTMTANEFFCTRGNILSKIISGSAEQSHETAWYWRAFVCVSVCVPTHSIQQQLTPLFFL